MRSLVPTCLLLLVSACAGAPVLDGERMIDLTHAFDQDTVVLPGEHAFELTRTQRGEDASGRWSATGEVTFSEHCGTHLDAPLYLARDGRSVSDLAPGDLLGPARVVDVERQCLSDRDYLVSVEDLTRHEASEGRLPPGSVVLIRTGWSRSWPDRRRYLGNEDPRPGDELHFPGLSSEAARLLADRKVALVGIDTASVDGGRAQDLATHRVFASAGVPVVENLDGLERLPARGASVLALPMKIAGAGGAPVRVVALLP